MPLLIIESIGRDEVAHWFILPHIRHFCQLNFSLNTNLASLMIRCTVDVMAATTPAVEPVFSAKISKT